TQSLGGVACAVAVVIVGVGVLGIVRLGLAVGTVCVTRVPCVGCFALGVRCDAGCAKTERARNPTTSTRPLRNNGDVPFGYRWTGPKTPPEHDPDEYPGLRMLGELRIQGFTADEIAETLNA